MAPCSFTHEACIILGTWSKYFDKGLYFKIEVVVIEYQLSQALAGTLYSVSLSDLTAVSSGRY